SQVPPLLLLRFVVALAGLAHALCCGHGRDGDVPPGVVTRDRRVAIDLDVDHDRARHLLRGDERLAELAYPAGTNDMRAEALGVRGEIGRQVRRRLTLAVETECAGGRLPELRAK